MARLKTLDHGTLLRAKNVMDEAMPDLERIKELIPDCLHAKFDAILADFESIIQELTAALVAIGSDKAVL